MLSGKALAAHQKIPEDGQENTEEDAQNNHRSDGKNEGETGLFYYNVPGKFSEAEPPGAQPEKDSNTCGKKTNAHKNFPYLFHSLYFR